MATKYVTEQGDLFDEIALLAYDDEHKAPVLIDANPQYAGVIVFDAGVELMIPEITTTVAESLPPWKRATS